MCQQSFIYRYYVKEHYDTALEALEELRILMPVLESYAGESETDDTIQRTKSKIGQAEALLPKAKAHFEAKPIIDQMYPLVTAIQVRHF